jgi:hypothetical protein
MAKFKVVAYSATAGKKVYKAHSIIDESEMTADVLVDLLKRKFIAPCDDEDLEAKKEAEEEEKIKDQIKAEEKAKKDKENKNKGA